MDPESVFTRVERTFWTAWYYITGAVNRFIRPEPADITSNDIQAIQGSAVDSEPVNSGDADGDVGGRGIDEQQPLATASLLSSSRPLVARELCATDIDLGHDEESVQYTVQPNRIGASKATEEGEGTREEQFAQARNDDAGLLVAKEDKQEENGDRKRENEEHTNTRSQRLTGDAMCEDMEENGRNTGAEEVSMTVDDHQKMDETIPVKEEDDKMQHEHKQDLVAEDIEVELCTIKDLSVKDEDNMHIEEAKLQRNEADTAVTHEEAEYSDSVQQLASQNENKSDEAATQVENQLSVCEELSDDGRDFKGDPGFTSLHVDLQMTYDKSAIVSEEEVIVVEQENVMTHRSGRGAKEEDESALDEGAVIEEENMNEAANNQTTDEAPEQEDDIRTVTENGQEDDNLNEHEEVTQNAKTEPHTAENEEHTNTRSQRLKGDAMCEDMEESGRNTGAEEVSMTVDDHQKMDETIPVKEEDDKMQHEHKQDLVAEDIEVELCTIKDLSVKDEDNMHIEEAKLQRNEADTAVTHEEAEYSDSVQQLASQNENKSDEAATQVENQLSVCEELSDDGRDFKGDPGFTSLHVDLQMTYDKSAIVSEEEVIVVEQENVMLDEGAVIEEENMNEAANNQTTDEAPEQEDDIRTVGENGQEEDNLTEHEEVTQNAKTEPHTAEFADREQEDVAKDAEVQTTTREADDVETESHGTVIEEKSDVTAAHISVEERLSSEVRNKENIMEIGCTTTSATEKPEGETRQEMTEKLKNIPLGICEGLVVVSQELNSPTCEETQGGVPEYNNEPGPEENTTQRFLEEGDCEEIQGSQLPEEVASKEPESLQNSAFSTEADYLLVREHMEEKQESPQDIKSSFEAGLPHETEKPLVEVVIQESGHLLAEEEGQLLVDLMKTGIEHLKFESDVGLPDESDKAQGGPEGLLVEFEIDEELHDSRVADAAGDGSETPGAVTAEEEVGFADETFLEVKEQKITETSFFQESVDAIDSEQNSNMTPSSLEDITKSGLLKQSDETEPELLEDVEMQDAGIDMEEMGNGVEEDAGEDEKQNKNEILHLQVAEMAESESYRPVESLQTENQLSDEALEISNEEGLTEAAGESKTAESKPKDLTLSTEEVAKHVTESEGSCAEETVRSISGHQDVIDEEILDLWIQTALSEDTGGIKHKEEPEPGHQMEPSNQEQDEISSVQTEKEKEQLLEFNSRESELVSDTEMSSSTVESGFLDQSLCKWGIQNSETQLLKTSSTLSFPGIYDMLANVSESANISELSPQQFISGSPDKLLEKAAETAQSYLKEEDLITERGFHPDTGVTPPEASHLNQESDKSQEKTEEVETKTGSQKEVDAEVTDWTDTKEAEVKPMTEMSTLFKVEKTKAEDESLEITVSDSLDQIKHTESGRSRSISEASLEEEIVLTESGLKGDTCTESKSKLPSLDKPQPGWSEDIAESLPGLNRAEVAEQPTTKDLMEVDTAVLDFTVQRSRISVKNPRVRPPKDPRSLLHKPSVDPTPSSHLSAKVLTGVPLKGLGIGIKLPGLGAGFPVLKKTQRVVSDECSPETLSQETKPEEKSDAPKQDEAQPKPKWMTPRHPGFGNPLMSELKTKLKKTTKE
ncbi:uncharacterized protein si:ch211-136m16.8 isoform X2 [Sander lucioperca]|uniref:uncharacterized protein si:ch211-136m16.8 isoform X2 n=1 Tax=Sander lucioperca TaxID=283035 RepID=UPI001653D2F8|nr:uncharacterized protein si:ch211-136m16.8 isoform X2 [Sander lucioperca]